ncbi:autotransporter outer membrane beta-barrel domain-containing protein [Anaeromassilibacillus senegalensis]|uniref:hypothetical protein n=1 Tax=Anaeromassilibacillus senegalensis TaxID=1673717 RepID=UPI00068378E0|nr:hypothetical protein [Anaeromassilibacillus senegalensis]
MNKRTVKQRHIVLSAISLLVVLTLVISATAAWFVDADDTVMNFEAGTFDLSLDTGDGGTGTEPMEFKNLRPLTLEQMKTEALGIAQTLQDGDTGSTAYRPVTVSNAGSLPMQVVLRIADAGPEDHTISNVIMRENGGVYQEGKIPCADAYNLKNILKVLLFENKGMMDTPDWQLVCDEDGVPLDLMETHYQPYTTEDPLPAGNSVQYLVAGWIPEIVGNDHQAEHFHANFVVQAGQTELGADIGDGTSSTVRPTPGPDDPVQDISVTVLFKENGEEVARTVYTFEDVIASEEKTLTSHMVSVPTAYRYDPAFQSEKIKLNVETGSAEPAEIAFTVKRVSDAVDRELTINWIDEADNRNVGSYRKKLTGKVGGEQTVYPDVLKLPEGYELVPDPVQKAAVTITEDGTDPETVNFLVREKHEQVTREVTVQWLDQGNANAIVGSYKQSIEGKAGDSVEVTPDSSKLPGGYQLAEADQSAQVEITADGVTPDTVGFTVRSEPPVSGDGTSWEQAIYITTPEELNAIRNGLNKYYKLSNDIDLSGYANWTPIGGVVYASSWFKGGFDGNGYKITNLTISRAADSTQPYTGLFGTVYDSTGKGEVKLRNVVVENANITVTTNGTNYHAGIVAGFMYGASAENCHTSGTINTKGPGAGGVIGATLSTRYSSYNGGHISQCSSSANITASAGPAGGVVGNVNIPVSECFFTGSLDSSSSAAGGIAGAARNSGTVSNCWSSGSVKGAHTQSGGVAGLVGDGLSSIKNSYTYAAIDTTNTVNPSTATGRTAQPAVGHRTGTVSGVFFQSGNFNVKGAASTVWDDYSGSYLNGTKKTQEELKAASTYAGWDTAVWDITDGFYPSLRNNPTR